MDTLSIFPVCFIVLYFIHHCFIYRPSDSTVLEDAEIEVHWTQGCYHIVIDSQTLALTIG
jgi:hypothetical protein